MAAAGIADLARSAEKSVEMMATKDLKTRGTPS